MIKVGQAYKHHPPSESYDAVIVGSGIGGMATGALLAKHAGKRVLLLERHYTAGGFTHSFRRPNYDWDVGLHYIGEVHDPRTLTRRLFDHVTDGRLRWEFMGDVYDRVCVGDDTFDLVAGVDGFRSRLAAYFPGDKASIDAYLKALFAAARATGFYFAEKAVPPTIARVLGPLMRAPLLRYADRTTREVLESLTTNAELMGVLCGQWGDYGEPPGRSSFAIHAIVAHHYLGGASYPVGGASELARTIAPSIEAAGGGILVDAEVERIVVEGDRAVGVRMADGREIRAPLVISDAGIVNTCRRLLAPEVAARHRLSQAFEGIASSTAHLCLYVGLNASDAELGLTRPNLWLYPGYDHDANVAASAADPEAPLPVVYASFPSAKDPAWPARHPGRSTIDLITFVPYAWFARWARDRWQHRGDEYEGLKARFAQRLLRAVARRLPQVERAIACAELSTPLSTRHFTNYVTGEIYGLAHTPARFRRRRLQPRTPVRDLYLTGQDIATCGVTGALVGGFLTASVILGKNLLRAARRAPARVS